MNEPAILILYNKMCYHLEDLHNLVNQYFPSAWYYKAMYIFVKDLLKMQGKPMNFKIQENENKQIRYKSIKFN